MAWRLWGKQARVDDGIIGPDDHVVGPLAGRGSGVAEPGRRPDGVAGGHAGNDAHVAVLTGLLLEAGGRRRFELAEGVFQPEAVGAEHVVTAPQKPGVMIWKNGTAWRWIPGRRGSTDARRRSCGAKLVGVGQHLLRIAFPAGRYTGECRSPGWIDCRAD